MQVGAAAAAAHLRNVSTHTLCCVRRITRLRRNSLPCVHSTLRCYSQQDPNTAGQAVSTHTLCCVRRITRLRRRTCGSGAAPGPGVASPVAARPALALPAQATLHHLHACLQTGQLVRALLAGRPRLAEPCGGRE